jgi:hypothetical protein
VSLSPPSSPPRPRFRWRLAVALALGALIVLTLVAAVSLYLARRTLGREALVGWLRERGVEATVEIERLEPDGFTGRIRIGPEADPEIVVDRAEVRYRLLGFWNGRPLGVEVAEVRLVRPVAKASWSKGKFSVGSLDRVLDEFRKAPPRPDARQPTIHVEGGRLILGTDYGRADVRADGLLEDGKLMRLAARLEPTTLRIGEVRGDLAALRLTLATRGDRVSIQADADVNTVSMQSLAAESAKVGLSGEFPYPDLKARRGDGLVALQVEASVDRLKAAETEVRAVSLDGGFDGRAAGWIDSLAVSGTLRTAITSGALNSGDFRLTSTKIEANGPAGFTAQGGVRLQLAATAGAQGAWVGLGAPLKADDPSIAAAKRLLGRFDATAPGLQLAVGPAVSLRLTQAARLTGPGGGLAVLTPLGGAPLFAGDGGAFHLALRGGGLPIAEASVPRYVLAGNTATATVSGLTAKGSLGPLIDADVKTSGRLALNLASGGIAYTAAGCAPVTLARLELGVNDVDTVAGELCPTSAPLLTMNDGAWRVRARAAKLAANAPFLEAKVADGAGTFDMGGKGEAFQADAAIGSVRVSDTAAITRFNPALISGTATSRVGDWKGEFAATDPQGRALGRASLTQTLATKSGVMSFDTGELTFAEGGLQPAALSPLVVAVASPASGRARFVGQVGWTEGSEEITGGGTLDLTDVGFRSPAGALSGLNGRIVFTSLVPALITAPGQHVTVARVASFVPLTNIVADVSLDATSLKVAGGQLDFASGHLRLDPFVLPLDGKAWEGVLHVDGVQLADLVKASPFADRVDVDAKVSGTVPFTVTPQGVRIAEGKLAADRAGRISIRREALTGVAAEGGAAAITEGPAAVAPSTEAAAPPPNTVANLAYQAMEDLAFEQMDVTLNSLPGGRLGGLFHIKGRHDPPQRKVLRLSLIDLITRKFLERDLPLPSGTPVNLTLDSSLNLDEVLRDVLSGSGTGSPPVQP